MHKMDQFIAVVGCGYWGKNLVRNFAQLGVLRVICDANQQTLAQLQQQYDVKGVTDFAEVLAMPDVKGIVIATPAETHGKLVLQALAAGKDVFVEKPLALTLDDAKAIKNAIQGHILMVGHLLEYHPALVKLKHLVKEDEIGKLRYLYSHRLSFGKVRSEENVLWSFAPHDICAILGLVEKMPISVKATGGVYLGRVEDFCTINLEFEGDIKAHIFVSWYHPFKEQRLVVVGESGTAIFDDTIVEEKLTFYEQKIELQNLTPILKSNTKSVIPLVLGEPLKLECQHFINCIQTRQTPLTGIQNGIDVLTVLQAAQTSLNSQGNTVYLKENQLVFN